MADSHFEAARNPILASDEVDGVHTQKVVAEVAVALDVSDIQIGAVELKDATSANRAAINASGQLSVDGSGSTQPVSAASLPLPTGAATAANQATLISTAGNSDTSLTSIDGKLPALVGGRVPVVLPAGGGGLTDAELRATAVPVSGTFWQATQPVSGTFWQATQPVSGTFWQATQPVSGPVTDAQLRASAVPVSLASTTITGSVAVTGPLTDAQLRASAVPVSGTVAVTGTFWQATQPVSGTFWQATQPVSGTFWQATQPISAASLPLPTGAATAAAQGTAGGKTITYVAIAQGAAGTTQLAAASASNKHKIVGMMLTMSLAGSVKFTDGAAVDLTGAMDIATTGGFVLPTGMMPYFQTSIVNTTLSIVTTVGAARGVIAILTEP